MKSHNWESCHSERLRGAPHLFRYVCVCVHLWKEGERMQIWYFSKQWPLSLLCNAYLLWHKHTVYHRYLFGHNGHANASRTKGSFGTSINYSFNKGAFQFLADTGEQGEFWNVPKLGRFCSKRPVEQVFGQYSCPHKIWEEWWKRCSLDAVPHCVLFFSWTVSNCRFSH